MGSAGTRPTALDTSRAFFISKNPQANQAAHHGKNEILRLWLAPHNEDRITEQKIIISSLR
jgi:hypothetical protein